MNAISEKAGGPLLGVKVLLSGIATAGPFAAGMLSDFGADVIHIENIKSPDPSRLMRSYEQDHRNQRSLALDLTTDKGKQVLKDLIKDRDIIIESSIGGQWEKWGLNDDVLWEQNPALVIVHVSGFGQSGDPAYISRPSWDGVGQAFGTISFQNGYPEEPFCANPYICDAATAMYASWSALAALINAKQTGQGESIDVTQFESMIRGQSSNPYKYFNLGSAPKRLGNENSIASCFRNFECQDGNIFIAMSGPAVIGKALSFFGFEYGSELFPSTYAWITTGTEGGKLLTETVEKFCADRTVEEAERELLEVGIPCSAIMTYERAEKNPHYIAREIFTEWETRDGRTVKGVNCLPKMKNNPGKIWKGAPEIGEDNEEILMALGYDEDTIQQLYTDGIIAKPTVN